MAFTNYPLEILPRENYIDKVNLIYLNETHQNLILIRRSSFETKEETFDELGILKDGALYSKESDIEEMSLNLLGGIFESKHLKWRQKGTGMVLWNGGKVDFGQIKTEDLIEFSEDRICQILLPLKSILEIEIPYDRVFVNQKELVKKEAEREMHVEHQVKTEKNKKDKIIQTDTFYYSGSVLVEHIPTVSNYWHVQINLTEDASKEMKLEEIRSNKPGTTDKHFTTKAALEFFQRVKFISRQAEGLILDTVKSEFYTQSA